MSVERTLVARASIRLRHMDYLRKWLILGAVIGVVAGLGALAFTFALRWATEFFLVVLGGYTPPAPAGEGATFGSGAHFSHPWVIPLIVALGGLLSGLLVFGLAPEAEGHGTDAAISAVHHDPKGIRARVAFVKIIASAITIGSGGSAGREGPTAQISAGFGSMLARWLDLTPADARIAVTVGIGSGIGAIFRAPLGGALLGAEVLYRRDVEAEALIPSLVASIVGYAIFGAVEGFTPIFAAPGGYRFQHPGELVYYAVIGVAAGLIGRLYASSFYGIVRLTHRFPRTRMVNPAVGGLLVGLLALALPEVLGTGYGWVQLAMTAGILTLPLWVVLVLPLAKILATSLSIGSGGSGGIFGPGMVIGGFLGAAVWRLTNGLPAVPHSPAAFVVVGMIACFGSIAHAPLAVMLMVAEMTGTLEMLAPAMVAVGIATVIVGDASIYEGQLENRAAAPANRLRTQMPLLSSIPVADAMRPVDFTVDAEASAGLAARQLADRGLRSALVVDADGVFEGSVEAETLAGENEGRTAGALSHGAGSAIAVDGTLDAAVDLMTAEHVEPVPVIDADRRPTGVIGRSDIVRAYRSALTSNLRTLRGVFTDAVFVEDVAAPGSPTIGREVSWSGWPEGSVVVTIERGGQLLFPDPSTTIFEGDTVSLLVSAGEEANARALMDGGDAGRAGQDSNLRPED